MAEQRSRRSQNGSRQGARGRISAREAVERVRGELPPLLGHQVDSVLGLEPDERKGWTVTVQVIELSRIPHSTDVLGAYAVTLDERGELISYKRQRRYYRNQADED